MSFESLLCCPTCGCHAKRSEPRCPHCGAQLRRRDGTVPRTAAALLLGLTAASMTCSRAGLREFRGGDEGATAGDAGAGGSGGVSASSTGTSGMGGGGVGGGLGGMGGMTGAGGFGPATSTGDAGGAVPIYGVAATDDDQDGYLAASAGGDDCDDSDPDVHPFAPETPGDGVDSNCDGDDNT